MVGSPSPCILAFFIAIRITFQQKYCFIGAGKEMLTGVGAYEG